MTDPAARAAVPNRDGTRRMARVFGFVAAGSAAMLVGLYLFAVHTGVGQRFDDVAYEGRAAEQQSVTDATGDLLQSVSAATLILMAGAIVVYALTRRRPRLGASAGAAIALSVASAEILKRSVFSRPDLDGIATIVENSFPSGHATVAMSLSLGLVMVSPRRLRWLAAAVGAVFSLAIGAAILVAGWHRKSDILGAYLVCAAAFALVTAALLRWRGRVGPVSSPGDGVEGRLSTRLAAAAGLASVVACGSVLWLSFTAEPLRTVKFAGAYLAGSMLVLAGAVVVVFGYHQLLRGVSLDPLPRPAAR